MVQGGPPEDCLARPPITAPLRARLARAGLLAPLLALSLGGALHLSACDSEEEAPVAPVAAPAPAPPPPAAPTFEEKRDGLRQGLLAGGAAPDAVVALLQERPEDDLLWLFVEAAAADAGEAQAWLDRWASLPEAGTRGRALTRARLALAAGRAQEAWDAALEARAEQPEEAAGVLAEIARRAKLRPASVDPSVDALVALAMAPNGKVPPAVLEQAVAVAGWRAALLRAEVRAGAGDWTAALDEYEKVVQDADPRAHLWGALGRVAVAEATLGTDGGVGAEVASGWCGEAVDAAIAAGDPRALRTALQRSAALHERMDMAAVAYQLTSRARGAMATPGGPLGAQLALEHARAARRVGRLSVAVDEARAALPVAAPTEADAVAWTLGEAAFALHEWEALAAAEAAASGPTKAALVALSSAARGGGATAVGAAPRSGMPDAALSALHLALAERVGEAGPLAAQRAVEHAERAGDRRLRVEARLLAEALLRDVDPVAASKVLDPLRKPAGKGAGPLTEGLAGELAARALLAGISVPTAPAGLPTVWVGLAEARAVEGVEPRWAALSAWQTAALALTEEAASQGFADAISGLPLHRVGALRTGTVLDGSQGPPVALALAELAKLEPKEATVGLGLTALEGLQRVDLAREQLAVGGDPFLSLSAEARRGLLDAAAQLRVAMTDHHLGLGPLPVEALDALAALEAAAVKADVGFAKSAFGAMPSLADMQIGAPRTAFLSYASAGGRLWGVVWSGSGLGQIKDLGPWAAVAGHAERHRASLLGGSDGKKRAPHAAGDQLRTAILEPFSQTLAGQGRFIVVLPAPLRDTQLTTLPDNREGLRWLASIRTIGHLDRISRIRPVVEAAEADGERYTPAYLVLQVLKIAAPVVVEPAEGDGKAPPGAMTKPAGAAAPAGDEGEVVVADAVLPEAPAFVPPPDLAAGMKKYDEQYSAIYVAEQATLEQWRQSSAKAQVIHLTSAEGTPDGGVRLHDGVLSVEDIRRSKIIAQLVVIAVPGSPEVQAARARAFLDAGAASVLVVSWPLPDHALELLMEGFFSALMRDRTPVKALSDARDNLLRDADGDNAADNPGLWGALQVYGLP
ncbi:MAG: hypothetical protein RL071_1947 [Pseudomonadota bacterium]